MSRERTNILTDEPEGSIFLTLKMAESIWLKAPLDDTRLCGNARYSLATLWDDDFIFTGIYESSKITKNRNLKMILLTNVRLKSTAWAGKIMADHLWFIDEPYLQNINLKFGDKIEFKAHKRGYRKHIITHDRYRKEEIVSDYRLKLVESPKIIAHNMYV